jgi:hypothetical protein
MKESVKVLNECIDLQIKKSNDYQNSNSNVVQAMHYRRGVDTIHDIIQGKVYRAQSLLESATQDAPNFESLEDTYKDIINYCSFAVSWLRGSMEGQQPNRDIFNKKVTETERLWPETFAQVSDNVYVGTNTALAIKGMVDDATQYC